MAENVTKRSRANRLGFRLNLIMAVSMPLKQYVLPVDDILEIKYPVLAYPEKVKSIKLDSTPIIESKLMGIRGQYLLLDEGQVINLRSHAGYRIKMEA